MSTPSGHRFTPWNSLIRIAQAEVRRTLGTLPARLRQLATQVPITFQRRPSPALKQEGIDPDTLGLFVGEAFPDEGQDLHPIPPQVLLFLENLWDLAGGQEIIYRRELRATLLHELGHYLGLDETDLAARGLE